MPYTITLSRNATLLACDETILPTTANDLFLEQTRRAISLQNLEGRERSIAALTMAAKFPTTHQLLTLTIGEMVVKGECA